MDNDFFEDAPKPLTLADCRELKDFAAYYQVSLSTVKKLRKLGVDLRNDNEVNYLNGRRNQARLLAEYRAGLPGGSADRTPAPGCGSLSLKDSLEALRKAEAVVLAEFNAASPQGRSKAQREWLQLNKARLTAEQQIFEVERLNSDSLPIDDVKKAWFDALNTYSNELEAIPQKWSVFLFQKEQWEVEAILKRLVTELKNRHLAL